MRIDRFNLFLPDWPSKQACYQALTRDLIFFDKHTLSSTLSGTLIFQGSLRAHVNGSHILDYGSLLFHSSGGFNQRLDTTDRDEHGRCLKNMHPNKGCRVEWN